MEAPESTKDAQDLHKTVDKLPEACKVVCPIENPRGREKTPGGPNNYQSTEPTAKSLFNRAKPGNEELTELQA